MVSRTSVHTLQRLLDGAKGIGFIAVDDALRVTCASSQAGYLLGVENIAALPEPLLECIRHALETEALRCVWPVSIDGKIHALELHLSHIADAHGLIEGHVVMLMDATAKIAEEDELRRRNAILGALINFDWRMHSSETWQHALEGSIDQIGIAAGFGRIQVFRNLLNGDHTSRQLCLHQWDAEYVPPRQPDQGVEFFGCTRWFKRLQAGTPVFGNHRDFPTSEQVHLKARQSEAMALVPVFADHLWWGGISFERFTEGDQITEEEVGTLIEVGRSLGMAIQRQLASESLLHAKIAFDSAAEGIMICDDKTRITAVNKAFTAITGYDEDEAIGRTPKILQSGKNLPELYAAMWRSIEETGSWRGELWNQRKNGEIYPQWLTITSSRNKEGQITHYVGVFADISESRQSQERLNKLVNHDPLTGLPNRRLLNELLERGLKLCERENRQIALLFIDLDRFKTINDTLGHHAGDLVLTSVTRRLTESVRDCDTLARLSGDEFIVMMDNLRHPDDAAIVARKIIDALQSSFIISGKEIFIGASIGISLYPQDGLNPNDLIKASDIAMYQAKNEGRNDFRFYTSQLGETAHERLNLDTMLRHALERDELIVHYQPQISLDTGRIIGAEALVRWQHPELGLMSPGKFIPLAEETGLIIPIGEWVLRQATTDLLRLETAGYPLQWISVNVSAAQLHRSNFTDTVYGVLVETGCNPEQLELEITESAIMNSVEYVIEVCRKLKDMGVKLALDDFGTGYSSLSYLKRFPLDKLKLDQSFVRELPHNIEDNAISGAIIGLGHNLGLTVIAEGVEKSEQETFLRSKGCQEAQGFLYSRPVPYTVLLELLASEKAAS